eukprot:SAG22_NODE_16764_length_318_cov_0.945205_1_plen_105_part_11
MPDPREAYAALTAEAAAARAAAASSTPEESAAAFAAVAAGAMASGEALLLAISQPDDANLCTKFFKLVLEMDPEGLRAAKLLQLSFSLYVDPTDAAAAREVDQLR